MVNCIKRSNLGSSRIYVYTRDPSIHNFYLQFGYIEDYQTNGYCHLIKFNNVKSAKKAVINSSQQRDCDGMPLKAGFVTMY